MSEALVPAISRLMKRMRLNRPIVSGKIRLVHAVVQGMPVTFCVDMKNDPIQRNHRRGTFYELPELTGLKRVFPEGGVFVDIGANVGNHTLYAALFLKAGRVIPVEPNPLAYGLLVQNVLVNRLSDIVDVSKLGVGVSDTRAGGFAMEPRKRNLGGAKMLAGEGEIEVYPAADLLEGVTPDLIKVDVEGMEMEVLSGLDPVLERSRPTILIEVHNDNEAAFFDWAAAQGYGLVATHQRYRKNKNHLIADARQLDAVRAAYAPAPAAAQPELERQT